VRGRALERVIEGDKDVGKGVDGEMAGGARIDLIWLSVREGGPNNMFIRCQDYCYCT
jgi:hypothetical protein